MKTLYFIIAASVFFMLFLTSHVYATCDIVNGKQTCFGMESILISIHSDKSHYENSDKPVITITGVPNKLEYLEIHNQSGTIVFSHSIELPSTGVVNYTLDISSYKLGVYSAIASTSTSNVTAHFMIGLPSGPPIALNVVKNMYAPGDSITIRGAEGHDRIIQLSLVDPNGNVVKSVQTNSDNTGQFSSNDLKIPTNAISGIWQINATHGISYSSVEIKVNSSSTIVSTMNSPLKQFKSGIKSYDVKCIRGFELILKTENNSPACVKLETAQKFVDRGWAKEIVPAPVATSNMKPIIQNYTGYQSKITPRPLVLSSCGGGRDGYHSFSNILNSTGFHVFYNITNSGTGFDDDYVIEPGHAGTITYVINAGSSPTPYMTNSYYQKELNITNYTVFYHYVTDYEELIHNPSVTIHNGDYESCFKRPNGSCAGLSGPITGPIRASVVDHPGVNVSFDPASELLQYNNTSQGKSSQIITMTVSVDYNSPQGTYWVVLSPEECLGGKIFLLTIGNQQYHELNR